jgi:hypothetical protein
MLAVQQRPTVQLYGTGALGGKGAGLVRLDDCDLPATAKLVTHILTTDFYDRFLERRRAIQDDDVSVLAAILGQLGEVPIGVRSSATDEAGVSTGDTWAVHAGENLSFMLPNNHPDASVRLNQLLRAVNHIYAHFAARAGGGLEKMAVVINPIPGLFDDTQAGACFYPYVSGVANSFFPYALKTQDPQEGYARIAFGHGYATVLDDFPVISMATIRQPIPLRFLRIGGGQRYFYALDLTRNRELGGDELETMKKLHVRFANFHKIRLLGVHHQVVTIEELVEKDAFGFKTALNAIMERIRALVASPFQIEFVFNVDFSRKPYQDGKFHVVQLTLLPAMTQEAIDIPAGRGRTYLSIGGLQGHGVRRGVKYAVVVSPRLYRKEQHDEVRRGLAAVNRRMRERGEEYLVIVPGRLGSQNRDWGIAVEYKDVNHAAAIFEYGVDICGRAEPLPEDGSLTGGIYGSHFLYMVLGGYEEDQRRLQTRMYGTQGTHFFTNIMSSHTVYGFIAPAVDTLDPWFFSSPDTSAPLCVLPFPAPATVYADSLNQRCVVLGEDE